MIRPLLGSAAALVLASAPAAVAQAGAVMLPSALEPPIAEASARFGVPAEWIRQVIRTESAGRAWVNGRPVRSRVGAMGLMQLMPATWAAMRRQEALGADPDDPRDNILAGTAYLRAMYDRFGYPGLFAAYNAGPARYADYLARERPLPAETIAYVSKVTARHGAGGAFAVARSAPVRAGVLFLRDGAEDDLAGLQATMAPPRGGAGASIFFSVRAEPDGGACRAQSTVAACRTGGADR